MAFFGTVNSYDNSIQNNAKEQTNNFNVPSNPRTKTVSNHQKQENIDLVIFVAKYHEVSTIKEVIGLHSVVHEYNVNGYVYYRFELQNNERQNLHCAVAFINDQGFDNALNFTTKVLSELRPHFVTTVGCCGGFRKDINKVIIFSKASYLNDEKQVITIECYYKNVGKDDFWEKYDQFKNILVRPRDAFQIHTISIGEVEEENEKELEGKLQHYQCHAQDMEIAAIFLACQKLDIMRNRIKILPAFKGVSDTGSKIERDKNKKNITGVAVQVAIQWIKEYVTL